MTTRPKDLANFCIVNKMNTMDKNTLKCIGKSDAYDKRRAYQNQLKQIYKVDKPNVEADIGVPDPYGNNSYHAGCIFCFAGIGITSPIQSIPLT